MGIARLLPYFAYSQAYHPFGLVFNMTQIFSMLE